MTPTRAALMVWPLPLLMMAGCKVQVGTVRQTKAPAAPSALLPPGQGDCPPSRLPGGGGCVKSTDGHATLPVDFLAPPKGNRPLLLVVNGGPGSDFTAYTTIPLFRTLANTYDVAFYSQRGTGPAPYAGPKDTLNTTLNADDLEAVRQALSKSHPDIVPLGHSYGGFVALAHAFKYPGAFSKLILLNAAVTPLQVAVQGGTILHKAWEIVARVDGEARATAFLKGLVEGPFSDGKGGEATPALLVNAILSNPTATFALQEFPRLVGSLAVANAPRIRQLAASPSLSLASLGNAYHRQALAPPPAAASYSLGDVVPTGLRARGLNFDIGIQIAPAAGGAPAQAQPAVPEISINRFVDCNSLSTPATLNAISAKVDGTKPGLAFISGFSHLRWADSCRHVPTKAVEHLDVKARIGELRADVLQVTGAQEHTIPHDTNIAFHDALLAAGKRSQLVVSKRAAHATMIETPECVEPAITGFLLGTPQAPPRFDCP